jgi:hypothetical protein
MKLLVDKAFWLRQDAISNVEFSCQNNGTPGDIAPTGTFTCLVRVDRVLTEVKSSRRSMIENDMEPGPRNVLLGIGDDWFGLVEGDVGSKD